jgi:hypothetical protein
MHAWRVIKPVCRFVKMLLVISLHTSGETLAKKHVTQPVNKEVHLIVSVSCRTSNKQKAASVELTFKSLNNHSNVFSDMKIIKSSMTATMIKNK